MKILIFGNVLVEQDSLPIILLPKLKELFPKIEFKHLDGSVEAIEKESKNPIIIDTVKGLDKVRIINLEEIKTKKIFSIHDWDLAYNLLLLKKLNIIESAAIIGVPMNFNEKTALKEIIPLLSSLFAGSE